MAEAKKKAERFQRLIAIRNGQRKALTNIIQEANEAMCVESLESSRRIDVINSLLDVKLTTLNENDQNILSLCELTAIDNEIQESEEIVAQVIDCQRKIKEAKRRQQTPSIEQTTNSPAQASQGYAKIRLPKLSMPRFKGDLTKWSAFWDSFATSIHNNNDISTIDKFNYLNSLLEGTAARSIHGLPLTETNYDAAIKILKDRFSKPQQIISAHMDELLKLQGCNNDRANGLRFFYDKLSVHVRGLQSLGVSSDQYGSLLIPIIMSKLPSDIRIQIARKTQSETWKINELLEVIKVEIEAREASERIKANDGNKPPPPNNNRQQHGSSSALTAKQSDSFKIQCAYCKGEHYSASCELVTNVQERKDILRQNNRCFNCLRKGHRLKDCQNNKSCRHCNKRHHQSICFSNREDDKRDKPGGSVQQKDDVQQENNSTVTTASMSRNKGTVLLQTAKAWAYNQDGSKNAKVRILFDNGSQRTYITNNLQKKLSLTPVKSESLQLNTFGDNKFRRQTYNNVQLVLENSNREKISLSALSIPVICSPLPSAVNVDYPHLEGLELAETLDEDNESCIDILVGSDYYWNIVTGETIRGESGPVAVKSRLGWLLSGPVQGYVSNNDQVTSNLIIAGESDNFLTVNEKDAMSDSLKQFWETESIGIFDPASTKDCQRKFNEEIQFNGTRYEVGLPWKDGCRPSSNHYELCHNRLKSLQKRLVKEPELLQEYEKIINEQKQRGIVEEVPIKDHAMNQKDKDYVHYMPHHGVIRTDRESTKLRVVYDGSAKPSEDKLSINDCLETGPNFILHLFDVLVKFRWNPVALVADIEKAFLMISIDESNRDMLRFLWLKDPGDLSSEILEFRFCRLVFGLRPSPAILGSTINYHLDAFKEIHPEASELVELIKNSLYVDDFITGADCQDKAFDIYQQAKDIMSQGGFNLRKWNSNSKSLLKKLDKAEIAVSTATASVVEEDRSYVKSTLGPKTAENESQVKILGISWNTETDQFYFNFDELLNYAKTLPATKRSLLKITAKIYDPLGLLSPFTVAMKVLFQDICAEKLDWDETLMEESKEKWHSFLKQLKLLNQVQVPRCYFNREIQPTQIQLHGFSDASERAYAAVVYMRSAYEDGHVEVQLISSKTRVSPVKKQSIPRLELLGATILARLVDTVKESLPASAKEIETVYWIDSMTTLFWICNNKVWKQYIRHRVDEILKLTSKEEWRFCPGKLNPADIPSRGLKAQELVENEVWWNGPKYLHKPDTEWPTSSVINDTVNKEAVNEMVKDPSNVTHSLVNAVPDCISPNLTKIIDCHRYSNFTRLLRITAYVRRFINNLRCSLDKRTVKELITLEIKQAEISWFSNVQERSFGGEIEFLKKNATTTPPTYVTQFGLYLDHNQIIRCKGRLNNASLPENTKNPIILPSKDHITDLIIKDAHERAHHSGINTTLSTLRERYWIIRGRETVKRNLRSCVLCKKVEGVAYRPRNTPDLPETRVSEEPPFSHTGVDFAGPVYLRQENTTGNQAANYKAYICLFTCASTRAIHLELTTSLSVEAFLMAFRRFIARRGLPATITSDNAKTFKGASKEVERFTKSNALHNYTTNNRITWQFIVPHAPWWGGYWERMVKMVKQALKRILGRSTLCYDEMNTVLIEVERVVNARPITYVYDDQESISYALTPSHLINGRSISTNPSSQHFDVISTNQTLTRRARHHRRLLQHFVTRWRRDYLLSLRENNKVNSHRGNKSEISVGDIVILKNDSTSRNFWKLGKIEELLPGRDGKVRSATVKVASDSRRPLLLKRVIQQLIPMEIRASNATETEPIEEEQTTTSETTRENEGETSNRLRRTAAITGELKRRTLNVK